MQERRPELRKKRRKAPDYLGYAGDKRFLDRLGLSASDYGTAQRKAADRWGV